MAFRTFEQPSFSRRSLFRYSAAFGATAAFSGVPGFAWAREISNWSHVHSVIDDYVGSGKLANIVATFGWEQDSSQIVARGPQTIGMPQEADYDSLYRLYSMTKPITGMAAMMLIDEGKLGLDQPLAEIIPAFATMQVQRTYDGSLTEVEPAVRPITIRHLLTHTAGLGYDITQKGPLLEAYQANGLTSGQVSRLPIPGIPNVKSAPSLAVFADRMARLPLVHQPGTKWEYSASLDILGHVIELVSGQTLDVFLQERLFGPSGMGSTWFTVPESEMSRMTTSYGVLGAALLPLDPARSSIFYDKPPLLWGGSGLVSSPRDYDRFHRMLLGYGVIDGRRVMSERAVRLGISNLLPDGVVGGGTLARNLGFGAGGLSGTGAMAGIFGWAGAAGTFAVVDFRRELRTGLFTQYFALDPYPLREQFQAAVLADLGVAEAA